MDNSCSTFIRCCTGFGALHLVFSRLWVVCVSVSRAQSPSAGTGVPNHLRALYSLAINAIEEGKQLWSERKKRPCLIMFQEVVCM